MYGSASSGGDTAPDSGTSGDQPDGVVRADAVPRMAPRRGAGTGRAGVDPAAPWDSGSDAGWPTPPWGADSGTWTASDSGAPNGEDAGGSSGDDAGTPSGDDAGGGNAALLTACAGGINAFRGQNDLTAYTRSSALEAFAAQAAASDALSGQQDGYFDGNGGNNVSFAEDEFDGDQVDPAPPPRQVLNQGLIDEEQDGEINGANNLLSEQFSEVGCGVARASDGSYWITIEYQ